jgi:hypothetical protein
MAEDKDLDSYIETAARMLALPLDDASRPAVRANLATIFSFAELVEAFPLPDEVEPAPIFRA